MVVDAAPIFLDRYAITIAAVRGKEAKLEIANRMAGLTKQEQQTVRLKAYQVTQRSKK